MNILSLIRKFLFLLQNQVKNNHLKANEWVQKVISEANGRGGGKDNQAQAANCDAKQLDHCVQLAEQFALLKLNAN